eukprot:6172226-Pleurochrysis_carterae.AAC.1
MWAPRPVRGVRSSIRSRPLNQTSANYPCVSAAQRAGLEALRNRCGDGRRLAGGLQRGLCRRVSTARAQTVATGRVKAARMHVNSPIYTHR